MEYHECCDELTARELDLRKFLQEEIKKSWSRCYTTTE